MRSEKIVIQESRFDPTAKTRAGTRIICGASEVYSVGLPVPVLGLFADAIFVIGISPGPGRTAAIDTGSPGRNRPPADPCYGAPGSSTNAAPWRREALR